MFFVKDFTHIIHLNPCYLGPKIQSLIKDYLYKTIEGSCNDSGYVISVLEIDDVSEGTVSLNGATSFKIKYKALVLKPFKGETMEASVVEINKMGVFASVGPLTVFVSNHQIPSEIQEGGLLKDSIVRLKIIGTKIDSSKIYAVGTLNDEYLGILS
ncbi:hypothetical protein NCER_101623 [Vairimorpha ceranae BRL01]|uniref:Uncharacterized protein n=2 Tax=Vairimorpha ceranae TaxID=40302 RepID=C4VAF6_VAIC1|nr:dna-directed rna polymerase ii subunit rpb7 [Vairimorpha ceranae]EEQ81799.1 hypothetical protein NCER_101623 [Vairimorpha ceranae BRL01]KAF5141709.1 hypothetical protein G9O61_00g002510 [Vairimorpha ceranae]KKO76707.1 dna-directed rna polymerase ii subunit rpb7 [Vairimorpha ceranae]